MQKNDILTLSVDDTTAEGDAVCRHDGMVVFVPSGIKGETLNVKILKVKKNYGYGKIESIIKTSGSRIAPVCPVSTKCGGCVFGHMDYKAEAESKAEMVKNAFLHIGGITPEFEAIVTDKCEHYRNKAQYPVDISGNSGFFARHSHRIIPCDDCLLQPEIFKKALQCIKFWMQQNGVPGYDEQTNTGTVRHIYLRIAEATGQIMVTLVINSKSIPNPNQLIGLLQTELKEQFKTLVLNINRKNTNVILSNECRTLYGDGYITDIICGVKIRISPVSFYQVNRTMAQKLYTVAKEYAAPSGKTVLDLYCGAGAIGLSMANEAKEIIGVEIIPQAVEDAKFNAANNGIENASFICADAAEAAEQLKFKHLKPDVVILDPPRKGCDEQLINTVAAGFSPERIVYVSCDPATLARDCARFAALGYKTVKVTPCDLFPRTAHCESVALLVRTDSSI